MEKILAFHQGGDIYGSDLVFLKSCTALSDAGMCLRAYLDFDGPLRDQLHSAGVDVKTVDLAAIRKGKLKNPFLYALSIANSLSKLFRILRSSREVKTVYINTVVIPLPLVISSLFRKRIFVHIHETIRDGWTARIIYGAPAFFSHKIICVSNSVSMAVIRNTPSRFHKKIVVMHNGIDDSQVDHTIIQKQDTYKSIIYVGRLSFGKGVHCLIEALKHLRPCILEKAHLNIFGSVFPGNERYEAQLQEIVASNNLSEKVTFHGHVTNARELIASADLLILPSCEPDSFPTVVLEAMSESTPVIVTDCGGATEMIEHEVSGLIVAPGSSVELALAVNRVFDDYDSAIDRAKFAREVFLNNFSLQSFNSSWIKLFESKGA